MKMMRSSLIRNMRHQQSLILALVPLVAPLIGCRNAKPDAAPRPIVAPDPSNPLRILGTVSTRAGVSIPTAAQFEIVVGRANDPDEVVAVRPLPNSQTWPAPFQLWVKWPAVPEKGQRVTWKASPPVLSVFVRGAVAGRPTFISEPQTYTVHDSDTGRAVKLLLIPVIE
jgi:hypothetical protein